MREAAVWHNTERVGTLREVEAQRLLFRYEPAWAQQRFPISFSLTLSTVEQDASAYFEGLLPEGRARTRITRQLKLAESDDMGLLLAIGRDCAGALSILPIDEQPDHDDSHAVEIASDDFANFVETRGTVVSAVGERRRFSLAGAQDKLAVIVEASRMLQPTARFPSTHIVKFETLSWVCFAAYAGNQLANRLGLQVCETKYVQQRSLPYLLVKRYDRATQASGNVRLHQEDIAQAMGYRSDAKYEHDGGPSLPQIADFVRAHVQDPVTDIVRLRDWQIFNYLIGNSDAHAKNLAILYPGGESVPVLAPFYDLVCIEFHNRIGVANFDRSMALFVGTRSEPEEIRRKDWQDLADGMRVSPAALLKKMADFAERLPQEATFVRREFAAQYGDNQVYDRWLETIRDRCHWVRHNVLK